MDWKIGDDTTSYYCVRTVTIHFHVNVLFKRMGSPYVCIEGEPTKGLYFQGQSTSRFSAFPSSLPRRLNTQESSMQNGSFKFVCNESDWIFETCHGIELLCGTTKIDVCAYAHTKKHYTYSSWNMYTYWKTYYSMSTEGPTVQTIPTPQQQTYSTFHPTEKAHRVEFFDENTHPWEDVEIKIPKPETWNTK